MRQFLVIGDHGRSHGRAVGIESPLGWMPRHHDLNWDGLETFTEAAYLECMSIDAALRR